MNLSNTPQYDQIIDVNLGLKNLGNNYDIGVVSSSIGSLNQAQDSQNQFLN